MVSDDGSEYDEEEEWLPIVIISNDINPQKQAANWGYQHVAYDLKADPWFM